MSPIASARVEAICMLCFNLQGTLQLVSIPEDEHVNLAFFRNKMHFTETSQHALKLGRGRILIWQRDKKVKNAYVPVHVLHQGHKSVINI